ncbi:MAG: ATP-dependent helicase C-terminal domain-containing protein, partial [Pseudomonadota bacterium]
LALWGADDPAALRFLDAPPGPALAEARRLLGDLGALAGLRITDHGRKLAAHPAHPRLAHMLERAGEAAGLAALLAALLGDRDPWAGRGPADITQRLRGLIDRDGPEARSLDRGAAQRIRAEAKRLSRAQAHPRDAAETGRLLALAYPDRVGLRRPGEAPRFLLSGGRGAVLAPEDPLAGQRLLVAAELEDSGREATIRLAAPLAEAELRSLYASQIAWEKTARWSPRTRRVEARAREMFGALALADQHWRDAPPEALGQALADGIRDRGLVALPWRPAATYLRNRVAWLRTAGEAMPDWSDGALLAGLDTWLTPHLAGLTRIEEITLDLAEILRATLDWETRQRLDTKAPSHIETPLGSRVPIDYGGAAPTIRVRVQEMFGLTTHPEAAGQPLVIELLSPAGRSVQTTADLPGFWAGSYADVAKDMRARYPKHPWPEDPAAAPPTRRTKRKG